MSEPRRMVRQDDERSSLERIFAKVDAQIARMPAHHRAEWEKALSDAESAFAGSNASGPVHELDISWGELQQDSVLLDRTIRAVCMEKDLDYLGGLELISQAADSAAGFDSSADEIHLGKVFEAGGLSLAAVRIDVDKIVLAEAERDRTIELATPGQRRDEEADNVEVDEAGQVLFGDDVDVAKLITDPYWLERYYQRAVKVDANYIGEKEKFVEDFMAAAREGIDLVATIEREKGLLQTDIAKVTADRRLAHREQDERERRARRREIDEQVAELQKRRP